MTRNGFATPSAVKHNDVESPEFLQSPFLLSLLANMAKRRAVPLCRPCSGGMKPVRDQEEKHPFLLAHNAQTWDLALILKGRFTTPA